jgi:hypothetical protein
MYKLWQQYMTMYICCSLHGIKRFRQNDERTKYMKCLNKRGEMVYDLLLIVMSLPTPMIRLLIFFLSFVVYFLFPFFVCFRLMIAQP